MLKICYNFYSANPKQGYQYFFLDNFYKCLALYLSENYVQIADIPCDARLCLENLYEYCQKTSSSADVFVLWNNNNFPPSPAFVS